MKDFAEFLRILEGEPIGKPITLPLLFSKPVTHEQMGKLKEIILHKQPTQLLVVGLEDLSEIDLSSFSQTPVYTQGYSYQWFDVIKWLFALPIAEVVFHFDNLDPEKSRGREVLQEFCAVTFGHYITHSKNKPFINCELSTSDITLLRRYKRKFMDCSLQAIGEKKDSISFEESSIIYQFELAKKYVELKNYKEAIIHFSLLHQQLIQHYTCLPDHLNYIEAGATKILFAIGKHLMKDRENIVSLFTALDALNTFLWIYPFNLFVASKRVECTKSILKFAKTEERKGIILYAFSIYEDLNKKKPMDLYERTLFLLRHYDNESILISLKKNKYQLLNMVLKELKSFKGIAESNWELRIENAIVECTRLKQQYAPAHQTGFVLLPPLNKRKALPTIVEDTKEEQDPILEFNKLTTY